MPRQQRRGFESEYADRCELAPVSGAAIPVKETPMPLESRGRSTTKTWIHEAIPVRTVLELGKWPNWEDVEPRGEAGKACV